MNLKELLETKPGAILMVGSKELHIVRAVKDKGGSGEGYAVCGVDSE